MRQLNIGEAVFDVDSRELAIGVRRRRLEPKAAAVLMALAARPGETVARGALLDTCWAQGEGSDEALTQAVAQIRRALQDDPQAAAYVQTVPRGGYRLIASTALLDEPPAPMGRHAGTKPRPFRPLLAAGALFGLLLVVTVLFNVDGGMRHGWRHYLRHHLLGHQAPHAAASR